MFYFSLSLGLSRRQRCPSACPRTGSSLTTRGRPAWWGWACRRTWRWSVWRMWMVRTYLPPVPRPSTRCCHTGRGNSRIRNSLTHLKKEQIALSLFLMEGIAFFRYFNKRAIAWKKEQFALFCSYKSKTKIFEIKYQFFLQKVEKPTLKKSKSLFHKYPIPECYLMMIHFLSLFLSDTQWWSAFSHYSCEILNDDLLSLTIPVWY